MAIGIHYNFPIQKNHKLCFSHYVKCIVITAESNDLLHLIGNTHDYTQQTNSPLSYIPSHIKLSSFSPPFFLPLLPHTIHTPSPLKWLLLLHVQPPPSMASTTSYPMSSMTSTTPSSPPISCPFTFSKKFFLFLELSTLSSSSLANAFTSPSAVSGLMSIWTKAPAFGKLPKSLNLVSQGWRFFMLKLLP